MMITLMIKILRLGHLPAKMAFTRYRELYLWYLQFRWIGTNLQIPAYLSFCEKRKRTAISGEDLYTNSSSRQVQYAGKTGESKGGRRTQIQTDFMAKINDEQQKRQTANGKWHRKEQANKKPLKRSSGFETPRIRKLCAERKIQAY
ncbi:uncharacterized protein LOC26534467 isoform X2 [Drosophila yakuba]|uniref:uncharacterized protein LOC26534467 isoform X2 n=1 Tax=Drosophila yakuba TaxID=7245 RepID=UPI0019307E9B|nr:uncharacterized protein LOC26534467 isoform X2 [Drosophila yakuba]